MTELDQLRDQINGIDADLIRCFLSRMSVAKQIAQFKKQAGLPVLDASRENAVLERVKKLAGEEMAPYAEELFQTLMRLSKEYQNQHLK